MGKKVLLVEDEPDVRMVIGGRLANLGFNVLEAQDGSEGLDLVRRECPDVVLLDLMIPKIDGYKLCRMIKFDKALEHIHVIIYSAKSSEKDKRLAEEAGADAYMTKPFDFELFVKTVDKLAVA
jgi:DNA-binding response OmpR family regulator